MTTTNCTITAYIEGCQTDSDGPQKQVQCVFPFELKGKTYYECTWREEENNKPWCSTKVDSGGLHVGNQGNWGYCAPECPMEAKGNIIKI